MPGRVSLLQVGVWPFTRVLYVGTWKGIILSYKYEVRCLVYVMNTLERVVMHTYPGGGLDTGILIVAKIGEFLETKKKYILKTC